MFVRALIVAAIVVAPLYLYINQGNIENPTPVTSHWLKLDKNGQEIANWSGPWSCVLDRKTGLVWEVKTDNEGIHDGYWSYSWLDNKNKGVANWGDCHFEDDRCDTQDLLRRVRKEQTCGLANWRLPTADELSTLIVDYQRPGEPVIDSGFFPHTKRGDYWTSDANQPLTGIYRHLKKGATAVNFITGEKVATPYRNAAFVRLVTSEQPGTSTAKPRAAAKKVKPKKSNKRRKKEAITLTNNTTQRNNEKPVLNADASLEVVKDTFIASKLPVDNFNGHIEQLTADGKDNKHGESNILMAWDVSDIKACNIVTSASVNIEVTNRSDGSFEIFSGLNAWREDKVTWNNLPGSAQKDLLMATFIPDIKGYRSVKLSKQGIAVIQGWLEGKTNNGIIIVPLNTRDGIDIEDRELGKPATLALMLNDQNCIPAEEEKTLTISNGSFESGTTPWKFFQSQRVNNNAFSGDYAARIPEGADVSIVLNHLKPNTRYKVSAQLKTTGKIQLYVRNYGDDKIKNGSSSKTYRPKALTFTTGNTYSSAEVYIYGVSGVGYADKITIIEQPAEIPH